MEKIKLPQLVQAVAKESFKEALKVAKPKYKDKTDEELAEILGLTEFQFKHFTEKALGDAFSENLEKAIASILHQGNSLEVPHQFNVFVHESKARKNENGEPSRKLSIRTRRSLKAGLNK
jgi:hypothetical protein